MADYIISTDSTADLPEEYIKEHGIIIQNLSYCFGEEVFSGTNDLDPKVFYARMRNGEMPTTNASIPEQVRASFEAVLKQGKDILHLGFSSALSSSCSTTIVVANELKEAYPERNIIVIDSLCASLGQGLFVHKAVQKKEAGEDIESVAAWLAENREHFCHLFTVDDLFHLHRGGRVSKATAIVGTIINVKPVLHVDSEGRLINIDKVRGRKKSLSALVERMGTLIPGHENDIVFISHGDCLEDAQFVADQIKERFGISNFLINYVSPTIGAHSGPGTVALFFLGEHR